MARRAFRHIRNAANLAGAVSTVALQIALHASPVIVTMQFTLPPSVLFAQTLTDGADAVNSNISTYQLDPSTLFGAFGPYDPSTPNADLFINNGTVIETITPQDLYGGRLPDNGDASWSTAEEGDLAIEAATRRSTLEVAISPEGDAVRITNELDTVPDLWDDPMWTATYDVVNQGEGLRALIADCSVITDVVPTTGSDVFLSSERTCRRVDFDDPDPFFATHSYNTQIYQHIAGPQNIVPCPGIDDCIDVFIGTVGDNYWSDPICGYFTEFTEFQFLHPDAITYAVLEQAIFDDYHRIAIGGDIIWTGPFGNFPTECWELVGSTGTYPNVRGQWQSTINLNIVERDASQGPPNSCYSLNGNDGYFRRLETNECWQFVSLTGTYPAVNAQWQSTLTGAVVSRPASSGAPNTCFNLSGQTGYVQEQITTPTNPETFCANPVTGAVAVYPGHVSCAALLAQDNTTIPACWDLISTTGFELGLQGVWRSVGPNGTGALASGTTPPSPFFQTSIPVRYGGETSSGCGVDDQFAYCLNLVTGEAASQCVSSTYTCDMLGVSNNNPQTCSGGVPITPGGCWELIGTSGDVTTGIQGVWRNVVSGTVQNRPATSGPPSSCYQVAGGVNQIFQQQYFAGEDLTTDCINITTGATTTSAGHVNCIDVNGPVADTSVLPPSRQTECVNLLNGTSAIFTGDVACPTMLGALPDPPLPPNARCELRTSWNMAPNVDVRDRIVAAGGRVRFQSDTAVAGGGEGYSRLRIRYDVSRIVNSVWAFDPVVLAELEALEADGACALTRTCTNLPIAPGGCFPESFGTICESDLTPSPIAGIPTRCRAVEITANCSALTSGTVCFPDAAAPGGETCVVVDLTADDACSGLESDPACGFVSRTCAEDGVIGGACRIYDETWDCGSLVTIPGGEITETLVCSGDIGCVGDSCVLDGSTPSTSFASVATALSSIEQMVNDIECEPTTTSLDECTVFRSEVNTCRDSFFGVYNCCDTPSGISLADYLRLGASTVSAARAADALFFASAGQSAFHTFMQPVYDTITSARTAASQAFTAIQRPFVELWNGITGQTVEVAEFAISGLIESVTNQLLQSAAQFTLDVFGPTATNFLFTAAGGGPAASGGVLATQVQLSPIVVGALNVISLAFAAYSIATILLALLFACEENEAELATKRELRSTTYVGRYCSQRALFTCLQYTESYCQYNSPLSRIVMEQIATQWGWSYGSAETPNCPSLTLADVNTVDWDAIDLSEWTGILATTGRLPEVTSINVENLTGEDSNLGRALSGVRLDAIDRAEERGRNIEIDNIRRAAADGDILNPPDITTELETTTIACGPEYLSGDRFYQRTITTTVTNPNPGVTTPVTTVDIGPWEEYANDCVAACWEFGGFTDINPHTAIWSRGGVTITRFTGDGPPDPFRWSNPSGLQTAAFSGAMPTGCGVDDEQYACGDVSTGIYFSYCSSGGASIADCAFATLVSPGVCTLPTPSGPFLVPPIPFPG